MIFDVIVVGLGAMGSSACYYLSLNELNVLGIDQFKPPHNYGSSHGESRIIREAYFEHPLYVPLVQRAYKLWFELEKKTNKKLFMQTGGIMLGTENSTTVKGSELSAKTFKLDYEKLNSQQIQNKFPGFNVSENTVGILEKRAGILFPEKCIETYLEQAEKNGANLKYNEKILYWSLENDIVKVKTDKSEYYSKKIIFTSGAWIKELVPDLQINLTITRQTLFWFETKNAPNFKPDNFPVYIWEYDNDKIFYGFPDIGYGTKIAFHHLGKQISPETIDKSVSEAEKEEMINIVSSYLSLDNPQIIKTETCMYTNTYDQNFIIDFYKENSNIIIASPCSGHGFKFSSVIGEILNDMVTQEKTSFDLTPFSFKRH